MALRKAKDEQSSLETQQVDISTQDNGEIEEVGQLTSEELLTLKLRMEEIRSAKLTVSLDQARMEAFDMSTQKKRLTMQLDLADKERRLRETEDSFRRTMTEALTAHGFAAAEHGIDTDTGAILLKPKE